jgi:hypothetical protein
MDSKRQAEWAEAKRRCPLSEEAIRMARELGLNPRSLIKNIPSQSEPWKAPVEDWVRDLFERRFGNRTPQAHLPPGLSDSHRSPTAKAQTGTSPARGQAAVRDLSAPFTDENPAPPKSTPNLYAEAEAELLERFDRGEIDPEVFSEEMNRIERHTPVSEGEVEQQNQFMLKRREAFRRAADRVAAAFAQFPFVQKVVLFGSVAAPPRKEVPRFRRLRRAQAEIWHECNDVDLAVWVTGLTGLRQLKKALSAAVNLHNTTITEKLLPGVAHHQVDVFLFEPRTNRFRGNLCFYGNCPKDKPDCEVPGCGAQPFLRLFEDYKFDHTCLFAEHNVVLFERKPAEGPPAAEQEVPF